MPKQILILTPDGVGSTLLQRSLCVLGNLHDVYINPHELTNGLKYCDSILIKDYKLEYSQELNKIIELLQKNKNNLIARLAYYHIVNRKDNEVELLKFYKFLNENFLIISCHRKNLLEYAMSWGIRKLKSTLNVYSFNEKFKIHPKQDLFSLDEDFIEVKCNDYKDYLNWLDNFFPKRIEFYYEDIKNIDTFISNILNVDNSSFKEKFGISLSEYCFISSLDKLDLKTIDKKKLMAVVKIKLYCKQLIKKLYMPNSLPLKMNSFYQKKVKCKNFLNILDTYNNWTKKSNVFSSLSLEEIENLCKEDFFYVE